MEISVPHAKVSGFEVAGQENPPAQAGFLSYSNRWQWETAVFARFLPSFDCHRIDK